MTVATALDISNFEPSPDLLNDRVILVTGANRGIGAATALACAQHGATVILLGRDQAGLETIDDQIQQATGQSAVLLPFDLKTNHAEAYHELYQAIMTQFGRLDGLVHCAAILGQHSPIEHQRHQDWEAVFQVNVHGVFHLTKALLPALQASNQGRLVFLSSSVGRQGRANWGAYSASKFAIEGLAQILAEETAWRDNFCVNVVNPGATRTAMRAAAYPGEDPQQVTPPEAHNTLMLYLLSSACTGQTGLSIDAQPR